MAYKESTPIELRQMYHRLACKDIEGPKLAINIPNSMEIMPPRPHLPALDRLKNYRKEDVNLELIDGMLTSTYTPDSMGEEEEYSMYEAMSEALQDMITHQAEELFDSSASDANIPAAAAKGAKTRDTLKQLIESSCEMADEIGPDATRELQSMLSGFGSWCNERRASEEGATTTDTIRESDDNRKKRKHVPMTTGKYTGTAKRIYNTYNMPR